MEKKFKCIILVTDGSGTSTAAEKTALNLARQHSARVVVVGTMRPPSFASQIFSSNVQEAFEMAAADNKDRLARIARELRDEGLETSVRILYGKSSEQIAREALSQDADLVIRYMKGAHSRHMSPFGNTARNLMRVCPCPLLLVGDTPIANPTVLACVNAEHDYKENQAILSDAAALVGPDKNLHALYCWSFYGSDILHDYVDDQTYSQYVNEAEQGHLALFENFRKKYDLSDYGDNVNMVNGDPIQVIPEVCELQSVDVVVMSSASQNHPVRRLLGSTIESVLDELPCALLVVKPLGFHCPVKPGPSTVEIGD